MHFPTDFPMLMVILSFGTFFSLVSTHSKFTSELMLKTDTTEKELKYKNLRTARLRFVKFRPL